jgi:hypothetical protein
VQQHLRKGYATELAVASMLTLAGFFVAQPIGPTAWDLVVRMPSGHWATVQVKTALRGRHPRAIADTRRRTQGNYDNVDFLIAYDLESHDFWIYPMAGVGRQITLNPDSPGYCNLEALRGSETRCQTCTKG